MCFLALYICCISFMPHPHFDLSMTEHINTAASCHTYVMCAVNPSYNENGAIALAKRTKNSLQIDSQSSIDRWSQTVAMTISKCAISATRCSKSGAIRARLSLAKSHDGNM